MSSILLVGQDDMLQMTRAAVLRTLGAKTICCHESAALETQRCNSCDVVVLCHTLPPAVAAALARSIHTEWPGVRILRVARAPEGEIAIGAEVVSSADPFTLVRETGRLLKQDRSTAIHSRAS